MNTLKNTLKLVATVGLFTLGFTLTSCNVHDNTLNVTINPPVITIQPVSVTVTNNSTATFTVSATGDSLAFQWVRESDGTDIAGATTATLTLTSVTTTMNGSKYHCRVKNPKGTVTTTTVTLTVTLNPPAITAQPVNATVVANSTATFTVVATGDSLSFQWVRESDGTDIAGATTATLTLTNVTTTMNGSRYHCNLRNSTSTVTTVTVTLTVTATSSMRGPAIPDASTLRIGSVFWNVPRNGT